MLTKCVRSKLPVGPVRKLCTLEPKQCTKKPSLYERLGVMVNNTTKVMATGGCLGGAFGAIYGISRPTKSAVEAGCNIFTMSICGAACGALTFPVIHYSGASVLITPFLAIACLGTFVWMETSHWYEQRPQREISNRKKMENLRAYKGLYR